jgi:hypothetical protein
MPPAKQITYFGQLAFVDCDRQCHKAWGSNTRPKQSPKPNPKHIAEYLSDDELGMAPSDPKTYEGGQGKPKSPREFPNKWCVRECERCVMARRVEDIKLRNFTKRITIKI